MRSNRYALIFLLFILIKGTSIFGQNLDSLHKKKVADSLMQRHSVDIPLAYIEKVDFKLLEPGKPVDIFFRNFKNNKYVLDTIRRNNYGFTYYFRIGEFSGNTISIIISENRELGTIDYYFSETAYLFLKSIKNKEKSFASLTKDRVKQLVESNGEIRIDPFDDHSDWQMSGWDTLTKKTYFSLSYRTIVKGSSEESYLNFENRLISIHDLENFPLHTPIIVLESADPIVCYPESSGYGIARKHRVYFDVNTMTLLYDGFPSFRFFVNIDKF